MAVPHPTDVVALLRLLVRHDVDFIVVGGVAGVLAGCPLQTFDLDIVVDQTEENISRLVVLLREINASYRDPVGRVIEPDAQKLATFHMNLLRTDLGDLDVLTTIGDGLKYRDLFARSREYALAEVTVRAVDLPTLIESKEYANREKDRYGLVFLRKTLALESAKAVEPMEEDRHTAGESDPTEPDHSES